MRPKKSKFEVSTITKTKSVFGRVKRFERRLVVWWIRFAQRHRHSHVLPIVLFVLLFVDGFTMIIPSVFLLVAATTISPQRWLIYGFIFSVAAALNNSVTYFIGTSVPVPTILNIISQLDRLVDWIPLVDLRISYLWERARAALGEYGPFATFLGALIGLPTQLITALIGISDAERIYSAEAIARSFGPAIGFSFLGHSVKAIFIAGLTRFGWVKLEKRFAKDLKSVS